MRSEKSERIHKKMKEKGREAMKRFQPYKGPPDLEFIGMHGSGLNPERKERGEG